MNHIITSAEQKEFQDKLGAILFYEKVQASQAFNRLTAAEQKEEDIEKKNYYHTEAARFEGKMEVLRCIEERIIDIL